MSGTSTVDTEALRVITTFSAFQPEPTIRWTAVQERFREALGRKHAKFAAAAAVLVAVSVLGGAVVPVQASGDTPKALAEAAPAPEFLPSAPLPVGTEITSHRWRVRVGAVEWQAQDRVAAATYMSIPPPAGWQWALVDVSVLNLGAEVAHAGLIEVSLVSGGLAVSDWQASRQYPAQMIPNALNRVKIPAGSVSAGYVGFLVPNTATDDCALRLTVSERPGEVAREVWLACA